MRHPAGLSTLLMDTALRSLSSEHDPTLARQRRTSLLARRESRASAVAAAALHARPEQDRRTGVLASGEPGAVV
jgi:hypothetical protein